MVGGSERIWGRWLFELHLEAKHRIPQKETAVAETEREALQGTRMAHKPRLGGRKTRGTKFVFNPEVGLRMRTWMRMVVDPGKAAVFTSTGDNRPGDRV